MLLKTEETPKEYVCKGRWNGVLYLDCHFRDCRGNWSFMRKPGYDHNKVKLGIQIHLASSNTFKGLLSLVINWGHVMCDLNTQYLATTYK